MLQWDMKINLQLLLFYFDFRFSRARFLGLIIGLCIVLYFTADSDMSSESNKYTLLAPEHQNCSQWELLG